MGNYTILEHIVMYMTDIDEEDFLDLHMFYSYGEDENIEEIENIKISAEYYNVRKLAYLSGLNIDPLALVYMLKNITPDKTYSDADLIDAFVDAKKYFCGVEHLFGGTNGRS